MFIAKSNNPSAMSKEDGDSDADSFDLDEIEIDELKQWFRTKLK